MKIETYVTAMELREVIMQVELTIEEIETNKGNNPSSSALNISLYNAKIKDKMVQSLLRYLKTELKKLNKEFDNLK